MSRAVEKSWPSPAIVNLRLLALELAQRVAQELDRDVDRDVAVGSRAGTGAPPWRSCRRRDRPAHAGADRFRHLGAMLGEDRRLGPRRVVLRKLGDRLEQCASRARRRRTSARRWLGGEQRGARCARSASESASQDLDEAGGLGFGHRGVGQSECRGPGRAPYRRDRPECSGGQQSSLPPVPAEPPTRRSGAALLVGAACLGAPPPRRTSFGPGPPRPVPAARPRRSCRQALAARRARRQGRRAQFLGHVVRAVPDRMPSLAAMAARRRGDGLVVAAVNYRGTPEVIRAFLARCRSSRRSCSTATEKRPSPGRRGSSPRPSSSVATASRCTSSSASLTGRAPRRRRCSTRSSPGAGAELCRWKLVDSRPCPTNRRLASPRAATSCSASPAASPATRRPS